MVPVNARPLQDVRMNHGKHNRKERPGCFLTTRAPIGQQVKFFKQVRAPSAHVKERVYPKSVDKEGDVKRYCELKFRTDETIFAVCDKVEMRTAKIIVTASSDFVHTSKSLFWPDVIMLAGTNLDLMQPVSMAIGVQRQTEMNTITIVFAGMKNHLQSRGLLTRLREPTTTEGAVWPAIKDILESMGEMMNVLKEDAFQKIAPKAVFALSPGYAHLEQSRRGIESPAGSTPDVNWDHARKLGRTDEFDPLPRTDERECEEVRDETIHRLLD